MTEPGPDVPVRHGLRARRRRSLVALLAALVASVLAADARADGGMFAPPPQVVDAVVRTVRTPDQRALLAFDGTTETLVIETTVQGAGTEFAWVLPLPAAPEIEASTTGLFATLDARTGPEVWVDTTPWWMAILCGGWLLHVMVRPGRGRLDPAVEVALLTVWGILTWVWVLFSNGFIETAYMGYLGYGTLSAKLDDGAEPAGVRVLSRATVGTLDTAVLAAEPGNSSKGARAVRRWLETNGFRMDEAAVPAVEAYVAEGWVFVASRVRADAPADAVRRIHPLAFRFPAKEAVYPMRLTGALEESLLLDLWVFGDRRAECAAMEESYCAVFRTEWTGPPIQQWTNHAEILRRAGQARGVTRLTGTFGRAAMSRDLTFTWSALGLYRRRFYTAASAATFAADGAAAVVAIGMVVSAALLPRPRGRRRGSARGANATADASAAGARQRRVTLATALGALAAAAVIAALLPRAPAQTRLLDDRRDDWYETRRLLRVAPCFAKVAGARAWLAPRLAELANDRTGEPLREEDSPGNYLLDERDGAVWFQHFGAFGPAGDPEDLSRFGRSPYEREFYKAARMTAGPPLRVGGQVLSPKGSPIDGATVRIARALFGEDAESRSYRDDWLTAMTDSDGRFEIVVPAGFLCDVEVDAPGHPLLAQTAVDLRVEPAAPISFVVPEGVPLRGRVVDASGAPVAGAEVSAGSSDGRRRDDPSEAKTADDGTFTIPCVAAGSAVTVFVHVHRPGVKCPKAEFVVAPGAAPPDLTVTLATEEPAEK